MADVYMLFTDALARAIHEGRKTVTRRPITARNSSVDGTTWALAGVRFDDLNWANGWQGHHCLMAPNLNERWGASHRVYSRHATGDTLIVRECFAVAGGERDDEPDRAADGCDCEDQLGGVYCPVHDAIEYRADTGASAPAGWDNCPKDERPPWARWRPSIHMPRWAARSVRRITSVTPERLGPLTDDEARLEGFDSPAAFAQAWAAIYGDKALWVWRYEFESRNQS